MVAPLLAEALGGPVGMYVSTVDVLLVGGAKTTPVGVIFSEVKEHGKIWYRYFTAAQHSPFLSKYYQIHALFSGRAEAHIILQQAAVCMHSGQAALGC